jgi:hypothetical protein
VRVPRYKIIWRDAKDNGIEARWYEMQGDHYEPVSRSYFDNKVSGSRFLLFMEQSGVAVEKTTANRNKAS